MKNQEKQCHILCWSDSSLVGTGYGVVSKHVLTALHNTGRYEIDHLAINYHGDFVDRNIVPWQMQPARLLDPKDPHGIKMFAKSLAKKRYDIVWILNDLYVTVKVTDVLSKVRQEYHNRGWNPPVFIHYYPVDCKVTPEAVEILRAVDIPVCYIDYGKKETLKVAPDLKDRIIEIPHGTDIENFIPVSQEEAFTLKKKYLNVGRDTTVVINVNRNSIRKQLQHTILCFKKFRETVPNSILYLHTAAKDQGGDLLPVVRELGLNIKKDVVFPAKFSPSNPFPVRVLNQLYNMADMYVSTALGEGFGLCSVDAMACKVPVVLPDNTSTPYLLGKNGDRGYMYPCNDEIYIDMSGFRRRGLAPDVVEYMIKAYREGKYNNLKVQRAYDWVVDHSWDKICKQWVNLFREVETYWDSNKPVNVVGEEV